MNQLWQYWTAALSSDEVNDIIQTGESYLVAQPGMGFDGTTQNSNHRSSEIRWISPELSPHVEKLIRKYAMEANKNAFGFIADSITDIQYTTYRASENGHYDWHIDTFWANPTCYDRKISVVIQLSDEDDYEGGDFLIDSQYPQMNPVDLRKKGTVIVFPSFIPHCVTPVTKGVRKSLVSWVQGPKFR